MKTNLTGNKIEGVFVSEKIRSSQKRGKMYVVPLTKHFFWWKRMEFLEFITA